MEKGMKVKTITIDLTTLSINGQPLEDCSLTNFEIRNSEVNKEITELTVSMLVPRTKVIIAETVQGL